MNEEWNTRTRQSVPVKLYRTPDRLVVAAPMPGVRPEDVTVDVTASGRMILQSRPRGLMREEFFDVQSSDVRDDQQQVWMPGEWWQETKQILLNEWTADGYYRELELPTAVDAPLGTATYGNGVLVVALPVAANVRSARLHLVAVGEGRGERLGSVGHPVQALRSTRDPHD